MPRLTRRTPRMCRHHKGGAFVKIEGRTFWLGPYGSAEAQEAYDRLIAEWLSNGRRLPAASTAEPTAESYTVAMLVLDYWRHAKTAHPNHLHTIKLSMRLLRRHYGSEPAAAFGPKRLAVLRDRLIMTGLSRSSVVGRLGWIKRAFRWAAAQELIEERTYRRLTVLEPVRSRDVMKPRRQVRPPSREQLRRSWSHMTRPVRGLVLLQRLTGARPGELLGMRAIDLDRSALVWTFKPDAHKTAHRGKERVIYFGPRAQRVLHQFMRPGRPIDAPLFSPREAFAEAMRRRTTTGKGRRPNQKANAKKTTRQIGDSYTTATYRRAIEYACKAAGVNTWTPHQLRHEAATQLRKQFGLDVASIILGHSSLAVTQTYAELNDRKAREVISKIG